MSAYGGHLEFPISTKQEICEPMLTSDTPALDLESHILMYRPEIEFHNMAPHTDIAYQISRGCHK